MKPYLLTVSAALLIFAGCGLLNSFTKFRIDYTEEFQLPAGIPEDIAYDLYTPYFATNNDQYFSDNNTDGDRIESCRLEKMYASITSPETADFSFMNSAVIYLSAAGMNDVKVASKTGIPDGLDTLNFTIENAELLEYIRQDSLRLRIQVMTDEPVTAPIDTKIFSEFLVDAKLLGE